MTTVTREMLRPTLTRLICAVGVGLTLTSGSLGSNASADEFQAFLDAANVFQADSSVLIPANPGIESGPLPEAPSLSEGMLDGDAASGEEDAAEAEESDEADEASEAEETSEDDELAGNLEELTEKLEALQADWDEYQDGLAAEAKAKKKKSSYKLGGRVHMDYWNFIDSDDGINFIESRDLGALQSVDADPQDRFLFRRLRLELSGDVPQNMKWRMQIDFNNPSTPEIKDAYLGWTNLPGNQVLLLGNQKRPLGLDHLNSSRFNVFAERPLAVETFNEDARRFGLCMYGHSDDESTGWSYGAYNLKNWNTSGRYFGDAHQYGAYGRYWRSPWYDETSGGRGYWHWAIAGAVAKPDGDTTAADADGNDIDRHNNEGRFRTRPLARSSNRWLDTGRIAGADWYQVLAFENILNLGSLQITGEYFLTPMQRDATVADSSDLFFHGGYIYASYFLTGEHMTYKRTAGTLNRVTPHENFFLVDRCNGCKGGGWGAWQVAVRYDHLDLSDQNIQGGVGDMITLGLNWHWTPYSKVQNNLIWGDIEESGLAAGSGTDGGNFWILGSRFMIDF